MGGGDGDGGNLFPKVIEPRDAVPYKFPQNPRVVGTIALFMGKWIRQCLPQPLWAWIAVGSWKTGFSFQKH